MTRSVDRPSHEAQSQAPAPTLSRTFADALKEGVSAWRLHRKWMCLGITVLVLDLGYSVYRAVYLGSSDFRQGYFIPTRGVLFQGKDLFTDYPYNSYTPFFYSVLAFFAQWTLPIAALAWMLVMVVQYVGVGLLFSRLLQSPSDRLTPWRGLLLTSVVFLNNLHLGQSNIFPLFFVVFALWRFHQGKEVAAGTSLAIAVVFKLTPALFAAYFAFRGRWRAVLATLVVSALCWGVVPMAYFGTERAWKFNQDWIAHVLGPVVSGQEVKTTNLSWYHTNQSLDAFVHRHFTNYGNTNYGGLHRWTDPAVLSETGAARLAKASKLLVMVLCAAALWANRKKSHNRLAHDAALLCYAMLFLSPLSWYSHYVWTVLPLSFAIHQRVSAGIHAYTWPLALAVASLTLVQTVEAQSYSLIFLGNLPLFFLLVADALRPLHATMDLRNALTASTLSNR